MNLELSGLINAADSIAEDAPKMFGALSEAQLNWKPDAETWSVGQCLDHLIVSNNQVPNIVGAHIDGTHRKTIFERLPFAPKFFGEQIYKAVRPESKRKIKAPRGFHPTSSNVSNDVVARFVDSQRETIEWMRRSEKLDLHKTVVTSHLSKFVTYTMFDCYRIVITHSRRHFRQAQNVMNLSEFPR